MYESLQTHGEWPDLDPNALTEDRIGENREAIYVNQHSAVTDPGCLHPFSAPSRDPWNER